MQKYQALFGESDPKTCDTAFVVFHDFYEHMQGTLNEYVYADTAIQNAQYLGYDTDGKELPLPKPLKKLEDKISKYGYRLKFPEGMPFVELDRSFISNNFYSFVSPEMKRFLDQLESDNDQGFAEDGGIVITEKEYANRMIAWENFVKENPDFILAKRVAATKQQLFTYLIEGMNNTPAYYTNDETQKIEIEPYFVTLYGILEKNHSRSETWKRVKPYRKLLLASDQDGATKLIKSYTKKGWMTDFSKDQEYYL